MNIVLWADLQCPFCLTGEACLQQAIKELGLEDQVHLDIKSYEIHRPEDSGKKMIQIFQDKEGFTEQGTAKHIKEINRMASLEAGLDIDFAKANESNDFDAHRLYKYALDHGCGQDMRDLLHYAYFFKHALLEDRYALIGLAQEAGLNGKEVERMLESDAYKREVRNDEMEFDALGLESVPYYIVDQEVIDHHLNKEEMMEVLKRHAK